MGNKITVTKEMLAAGEKILFWEYDPDDPDTDTFLTRLFQKMNEARSQVDGEDFQQVQKPQQ